MAKRSACLGSTIPLMILDSFAGSQPRATAIRVCRIPCRTKASFRSINTENLLANRHLHLHDCSPQRFLYGATCHMDDLEIPRDEIALPEGFAIVGKDGFLDFMFSDVQRRPKPLKLLETAKVAAHLLRLSSVGRPVRLSPQLNDFEDGEFRDRALEMAKVISLSAVEHSQVEPCSNLEARQSSKNIRHTSRIRTWALQLNSCSPMRFLLMPHRLQRPSSDLDRLKHSGTSHPRFKMTSRSGSMSPTEYK